MQIHFSNRQKLLSISKKQISLLVETVIHFEGETCDEVGIHLVSSAKISALHQEYFNDPSVTDCISFPMDSLPDYRMLGDVFACPEVAIAYAKKHKKEPYQELTLYIVHGLLHLMGYDDMEKKDRLKMRAAEKRHMQHLKKHHLWLNP